MELDKRPVSQIDDKILQMAGSYSPEEVSAALGGIASPGRIAARTQVLLSSRDWLTATQEDQHVTFKLKRMLSDFEERYMDLDNATMRLKLLKEIGARLEKRSAATEIDLGKLYGNQGRIMGQAVDNALTYMKGALREKVDPDLWDELVQEAMLSAQSEIAKHQAIEA